jgi:ribosome maturation protein SDO1
VSDKERQAQQDNLFKDVASILADKTINPETSRPYTNTMLERALRDVHFNPDPKRSAKQQALEVRCAAPLNQ